MTPFIHCKKAEIPGNKGMPTLRAAVSHAPTGGLLLSLPRDTVFSSDIPVEVIFFDPILGITQCHCRLSAPVPSGYLRTYRCEVLETLSQQQRREDLKVSLFVPVEVTYNGSVWPATVNNISASGVLLTSVLSAKKGEHLAFQFSRTDTPVYLTARILRVDLRPPQKGKMTYGYGCRFINLRAQDEAMLRSYVFQEERRLYYPD